MLERPPPPLEPPPPMEEDDIVAIKGVAKDVAVDLANVDLAQAKASELAAAAGAGGLKEIADTGVVQEVGGDMAGLFVAPVAGPSYCRVFFLLCVCGTIAWFIALISGSVSAWQEPVTEVTQELATELKYPDIYLCLPAQYAPSYNSDNPDANYLFVTAGTRADKDRPAAETLCGSKNKNANFLKMDPTIHKPLADVATADNACVYDDPVGAGIITADTGNKKIANNMILGCVPADCDPPFDPSSCENCKMTDGTGGAKRVDDSVLSRDDAIIVRNYVATLESLNLGDDDEYAPTCVAYIANDNAKARGNELLPTGVYIRATVNAIDDNNPYMVAYIVESGVAPYKCDVDGCQITATAVYYPGLAQLAVAQLSVEQTKDERKDDAAWHTRYKYTMWTKSEFHARDVNGNQELLPRWSSGKLGLAFNTFVVTKINIRDLTWAEIFADVGGLWAGAFAILLIVFKKSGHLNRPGGSEMYIFSCLLPSYRRKYLSARSAVPKDESGVEYPQMP